jgi:transcriptional regulator with XRE-family HTH domain
MTLNTLGLRGKEPMPAKPGKRMQRPNVPSHRSEALSDKPMPATSSQDEPIREMLQVQPAYTKAGQDHGKTIDQHIGAHIRLRRMLLGIELERLAEEIGVSHQHMRHYERGVHRVSAATLYELSRALSVPIGYFFEGLGRPLLGRLTSSGPLSIPSSDLGSNLHRVIAEHFNPMEDGRSQFQVLRLIRAYWKIPSAEERRRVLKAAKLMAKYEP